jgi:methionine-rich copper-binding protein CopC
MAFSMFVGLPQLPHDAAFHMRLKASVPATNDTLHTAPSKLSLTFTEEPEVAVTRLTLTSPDAQRVAIAKPAAASGDANTIVAAVEGAMKPGAYRVDWTSMSKDGHAVRGGFGFVITTETKGDR